jgi:hypothetical protein
VANRRGKAHIERMSRLAAAGVRPRRAASAKRTAQADAPSRALGKKVEARFRKAAAKAVADAHAENVPVAVMMDDGRVGWLYPDGTVRADGP